MEASRGEPETSCVFVFLSVPVYYSVQDFSYAVFVVSPPTWPHCKYPPDRFQLMIMLVIALPHDSNVDMELENWREKEGFGAYVCASCV